MYNNLKKKKRQKSAFAALSALLTAPFANSFNAFVNPNEESFARDEPILSPAPSGCPYIDLR